LSNSAVVLIIDCPPTVARGRGRTMPSDPIELRQRRRKNHDFHAHIRIHGVYAVGHNRRLHAQSADVTCRITTVTTARIVIVFLSRSTFSQVD
jgi:hypothetical protein